jgi:hypothetical protein
MAVSAKQRAVRVTMFGKSRNSGEKLFFVVFLLFFISFKTLLSKKILIFFT